MYADRIAAQVARHTAAVAEVAAATQARADATQGAAAAAEARVAGQRIAVAVQQRAHKRIARVVSRCLAAVLDDPYTFTIDFERRRGRTEAVLSFYRGEHRVNPMTASGGGVLDVAGFALRVANILIAQPPVRPVLVLDEPFRNLHSPEYRRRARALVLALSAELGVQFIIVTGEEEFRIGKVVDL